AAVMAARKPARIPGSGRPSLAATVISRASLLNSLDLTASCRPLRCMIFLNCECPAMLVSAARQSCAHLQRVSIDSNRYPGHARALDPHIHPSGQEPEGRVFSKKMDRRVKPGDDN